MAPVCRLLAAAAALLTLAGRVSEVAAEANDALHENDQEELDDNAGEEEDDEHHYHKEIPCLQLAYSKKVGPNHMAVKPGALQTMRAFINAGAPPPEDFLAAMKKDEFWRHFAICMEELSDRDFERFEDGELAALPSRLLKKARMATEVERLFDSYSEDEWRVVHGAAVEVLEFEESDSYRQDDPEEL